MQRCLDLAILGEAYVAPNPMVGCVIVCGHQIVAEGYHQKYGEPHAEVNAFKQLPKDIDPKLCDVYVNLEPCAHYGKTPPCADLVVQMQPKRLIVGMLDPNPKVAGKGLQKIRQAGISVTEGVLNEACKKLNTKFITFHTQKRPFITLKWAETADRFMGRDASDIGLETQISSPKNNNLVHQLRASHQGILIGANTANSDNPRLNLRYAEGRNPVKIILSKTLSLNPDLQLLKKGRTLVYNNQKESQSEQVEFILQSNPSIESIVKDLYERDIQSVLVEGGAEILEHFIESGLWDEAIILVSKTKWGKGIKAPFLGFHCVNKEELNGDTIKYFKR